MSAMPEVWTGMLRLPGGVISSIVGSSQTVRFLFFSYDVPTLLNGACYTDDAAAELCGHISPAATERWPCCPGPRFELTINSFAFACANVLIYLCPAANLQQLNAQNIANTLQMQLYYASSGSK